MNALGMGTPARQSNSARRRGGPLTMLGILFAVWILGRVALWENPFPIPPLHLPGTQMLLAQADAGQAGAQHASGLGNGGQEDVQSPEFGETSKSGEVTAPQLARADAPIESVLTLAAPATNETQAQSIMAGGHQMLMAAAFRVDFAVEAAMAPMPDGSAPARRALANVSAPPPSMPSPVPFITPLQELDRWSLDAFAYFRQGSNSALISQGRGPLYGASQVSANLQYRFAPRSGHDPRAYLRAYRALVTGGESEIAAGVSARPLGAIPVRAAAELRVTDNVFGVEQRPAAYLVTELPPIVMPLDFRIEAYGSAGYVGGRGATPFADGQIAVTRELVRFNGPGAQPIRFSLGGGAWGGAQEDASRVDVGPTVRMDLSIGEVPARVSVDWREQVAGDAAPRSGVAATLSTRF